MKSCHTQEYIKTLLAISGTALNGAQREEIRQSSPNLPYTACANFWTSDRLCQENTGNENFFWLTIVSGAVVFICKKTQSVLYRFSLQFWKCEQLLTYKAFHLVFKIFQKVNGRYDGHELQCITPNITPEHVAFDSVNHYQHEVWNNSILLLVKNRCFAKFFVQSSGVLGLKNWSYAF